MAVEETRSSEETPKSSQTDGPGPFVAIVRNHLDTEYMGTLEVELLKTTGSGNTTDVTGEMVTVSYLSPFYGITPYQGTSDNEGFDHSQKSYGMWAVPPDIGSSVLVIFAEGNKSRGFWIGCIQEKFMNFMVPGNGSTKYNTQDQSKILPVGEYNKRSESGASNAPTQFLKPVNTDAVAQLTRAGLLTDPIRGLTTSSARREVPSMVFGMSTPGPLDRRPGKPRVAAGDENSQTDIPASRLTGSSFVMDDGDPSLFRKGPAASTPSVYASLADGGDPMIPANELIRFRTRTGHQILLHNSEDLIYIAHGSGSSWIEMTAAGTIEVYSKGNISFHSDSDINFDAGKNINFKAGAAINSTAGTGILSTASGNIELKAGADGKITASSISLSAPVTKARNIDASNVTTNGTVSGTTITGTSVKASHPHLLPGGAPGSPSAPSAAGAAAAPSTVPAGSGSTASTATATASTDTFGACVAATPPVGTQSEGDAGEAAARANVTSTPSRTGASTADPGYVPPTTVPVGTQSEGNTGEAAARAGVATVTTTPSRNDPLP